MCTRILYSCLFLILLNTACKEKHDANVIKAAKKETKAVTILVQPFSGMPAAEVNGVIAELKKVYPFIELKNPIALPASAFYPARNRYRADSLINMLSRQTPDGYLTLALTTSDISTNKGAVTDWGVMGLGFCPGKACIASTFRLTKSNKAEQLFKVAIHEAGHTQGLPHCPVKYCFMRDAEGKNPTDEEKDFCPSCKAHLISKGWKLQ